MVTVLACIVTQVQHRRSRPGPVRSASSEPPCLPAATGSNSMRIRPCLSVWAAGAPRQPSCPRI